MLLDWLVFGLLVFGVTLLLNATAFKAKPASPSATWGLTIAVFFLNLVALSTIKALRYKAISDSLGGTIFPNNPLDWVGALVFTTLFFSFLRRGQKKQTTASSQEGDMTKPEPQPLSQDIPQNAKPHPEKNAGPSIPNASHKIQTPVGGSKFLILLMVFLVAGVVGGIGLIYLFSDSEEGARIKLTEMNVAFDRDTFFERIIAGDAVAVRLFLKAGVSPNSKRRDIWSALMLASIYGHQSVAEVLLKNGADINMTSGNAGSLAFPEYMTALEFAEKEGHVNLAKFLRSKGGLTRAEAWSKVFDEKEQALMNSPPEQKTKQKVVAPGQVTEKNVALRTRANKLAADQGLDMREGSPDYKDFWTFAKHAPEGVPFEDQVKWAVNNVKAQKTVHR